MVTAAGYVLALAQEVWTTSHNQNVASARKALAESRF
jgi:hypothetical protein